MELSVGTDIAGPQGVELTPARRPTSSELMCAETVI